MGGLAGDEGRGEERGALFRGWECGCVRAGGEGSGGEEGRVRTLGCGSLVEGKGSTGRVRVLRSAVLFTGWMRYSGHGREGSGGAGTVGGWVGAVRTALPGRGRRCGGEEAGEEGAGGGGVCGGGEGSGGEVGMLRAG